MYAEDLEVKCEDSRKISKEIDDLRSQLGRKVKELDYCKENNKLRAELCLKTKELECLRKQNEELEAKNEGFQVPNILAGITGVVGTLLVLIQEPCDGDLNVVGKPTVLL